MKMVYIASPYSIGDKQENVNRQIEAADELMTYGYCPVVPLYSHYQHKLFPRPYEDWMEIDFEKLNRSDFLLRLDGESKGADREVEYAMNRGIPVFYNIQDLVGTKYGCKVKK